MRIEAIVETEAAKTLSLVEQNCVASLWKQSRSYLNLSALSFNESTLTAVQQSRPSHILREPNHVKQLRAIEHRIANRPRITEKGIACDVDGYTSLGSKFCVFVIVQILAITRHRYGFKILSRFRLLNLPCHKRSVSASDGAVTGCRR